MTVLFLVYCTAPSLVQLMKQQKHPVRTSVLCLMSALVTLMLSTFRRFCTEANLDLQAAADDLNSGGFGFLPKQSNLHFLSLGLIRGVNRQ